MEEEGEGEEMRFWRTRYALRSWWKRHWPIFYSRRRNEEVCREIAKREGSRKDSEVEKEKAILARILPNMLRLEVRDDWYKERGLPQYQLCVRINPHLVQNVLVHGNSQEDIRYMAQMLAHQVERELLTINFMRLPRQEQQFAYR
jgi:hypothetical protein